MVADSCAVVQYEVSASEVRVEVEDRMRRGGFWNRFWAWIGICSISDGSEV